jgi:hypothetical protein
MRIEIDGQAWDKAFVDGGQGKALISCPYATGTTESLFWVSGYIEGKAPEADTGRVGTMDCSIAPLTEPDVRDRIRLFGLFHQRASTSWFDACGELSSCQRVFSETSRPSNQDGG